MPAKRRLPRALVLALMAGGVLAPTASAGSVEAHPEIYGAGSITGLPGMTQIIPCEQLPPAADSTHKLCSSWTVDGGTNPLAVSLYAEARGGFQFAGWDGCDTVLGAWCTITASSCAGTKVWRPMARFIDIQHPAPIPDLAVRAAGSGQGAYEATWSDPESHLSYRCSVDGRPDYACASGQQFQLDEGNHTISVHPVDPNGNAGAARSASVTVVDTARPVAPGAGATVRSAAFVARSGIGTDFECSLDGAPFAACGQASPGDDAALTLPALGDGQHTLRVRARVGASYDLFPVERSFTIDTRAPDTTIREGAGGLVLGSDEPLVRYACSLDGAPFADCGSPYPLLAGTHTLAVRATDQAGNVDPTPARHAWTASEAPAPAPTPAPAPQGSASPAAGAATSTPPAAVKPAKLRFSYRYRGGRFTRLAVTGVLAGTKLMVTVKCPGRKGCPKSPTRLSKLVGKRLKPGTRITAHAGAEKVTLKLRRGRGPIQTARR